VKLSQNSPRQLDSLNQLAKKIVNLAREKNLSVCTAESCTGGLIASSLVSVVGASDIFKGSLVCYSLESKNQILKIPNSIVKENSAVNEKCVLLMAKNAAKIFNCNYSISSTGFAESGGEIFLCVYSKKSSLIKKVSYKLSRNLSRKEAAKESLQMLLDALSCCKV